MDPVLDGCSGSTRPVQLSLWMHFDAHRDVYGDRGRVLVPSSTTIHHKECQCHSAVHADSGVSAFQPFWQIGPLLLWPFRGMHKL